MKQKLLQNLTPTKNKKHPPFNLPKPSKISPPHRKKKNQKLTIQEMHKKTEKKGRDQGLVAKSKMQLKISTQKNKNKCLFPRTLGKVLFLKIGDSEGDKT